MATLQIPEQLWHKLQEVADQQHRSIDEQAVIAIQQGLKVATEDLWRDFPAPEKPQRPIGIDEITAIVRAGRDGNL
jgi:hypothetical protein